MNYTGRLLPGWQSNPLWKKITSVILMPMKTAQNRREQEKTGGAAHNRRTCIPSPWQSRGPWTWSAARGIGKSPWWRSTAGKEVSPAELRFPMPHLSESDTNSKSSEKNLPTLKQLVQDNNEENIIDKMNTERRGQSSQEGDDASSWQSSNLKPNQCMVQGATDCVIREPLQKNYLKPKAKDQSEMTQNEGKIQKAETFGKSFSKRPLRSLMQTLDRPSVGKSPRPRTTESRYLGTLKVLDTKSSRSATFNLETADTIRASIYQFCFGVEEAAVPSRRCIKLCNLKTVSRSFEDFKVWVEKKKQICHEEQKKQKLKVQQENERREQITMYANQTAMFTAVVGAAALQLAIQQRRLKQPTVDADAGAAAAAEGMAAEWPVIAAQAADTHGRRRVKAKKKQWLHLRRGRQRRKVCLKKRIARRKKKKGKSMKQKKTINNRRQ
ncbi:microtubule-associated protein 9 isoform X4 [Scyliorhinus canicula]|uniref:microtubule-associated protein 9 isoform X4 n=1 Tax=Scyliorhinus canicula TaxID=7830 RepID=UPI0018F4971D|nr:microtubule-associated protein 9 isoform X4 [Scyliorhinus canicula]